MKTRIWIVGILGCLFLGFNTAYGQTAHVVNGVGAVNQGMAGAGTAMPLDASGALFWNPASITGLDGSELDVNSDLILLNGDLSSRINAGALAPGFPPQTLSGTGSSHVHAVLLPSIGWVHQPHNSRWVYGLSTAGIGGFGFNYKNDGINPITTPQPPNGLGFGDIFSNYQLLQIAPAVAYRVTPHWSVGLAPNLDIAAAEADPFAFAPPDDANGDGFASYPNSNRSWRLGGGVQGGVYYENQGFHWGASVKSPQWFQTFKFHGTDELGNPRAFNFALNYPMVVSTGVGYSGFKRLKWAADVKYIDLQNTKGLENTGFNPATGALQGLGWKSIWAVATGLQYQLCDRLTIRGGVGFNENPVRNRDAFFNVISPVIIQNQANLGFSYRLARNLFLSLNYHHGFRNSVQGPFQALSGPIPGTQVRSALSTNIFSLSLNVKL